ncbi:unknown [Clostridium sp. CAG:575]|nr:unknown [Clostridium sp. CAG:575]
MRSQIATFFYIKQKALRECVRIYDKIKKENLIAFYVKLC